MLNFMKTRAQIQQVGTAPPRTEENAVVCAGKRQTLSFLTTPQTNKATTLFVYHNQSNSHQQSTAPMPPMPAAATARPGPHWQVQDADLL
jgi:hypothetical protein